MSGARLRVLALAPYPSSAPSTGFRVTQYLDALASEGVEVTVRPFVEDGEYDAARGRGGGMARGAVLLRAARRMARTLNEARGFDAIWVQRGVAPVLDGWATGVLGGAGVPVVYDFDDAVFLPQSGGRAWLERLRDPEGTTASFCRIAAVVLAGNGFLADFARTAVGAGGQERVRLLPTVVDTAPYGPPRTRTSDPPVVGWVGSDSTIPYLETLAAPLGELVDRLGVRVRVVAARRRPDLGGLPVDFLPGSADGGPSALRELDVGLYPLDDTPWSRGKCGLKALQYLASGVPCVASPVGVLPDLIRPGATGYLAATPGEWVQGVEALLSDPGARARMGEEGRRLVEDSYSVAAMAPRLAQALRDAADSRP